MTEARGIPRVMMALGLLAAGTVVRAPDLSAQSCAERDTPNKILPGDPRWAADFNVYPTEINSATVAITDEAPRSGVGSLELNTSGSLFDWAFFQRTAGPGGTWGLLSAINCLTFDWFRDTYVLPPGAPASLLAETWQEQTPVLRLMIRDMVDDQAITSQLVWERWYNTKGVLDPTDNGIWHFEDLTSQQFWRHFDGGTTYTNLGCANGNFSTSSNLQTYDVGGWVGNCYSAAAQVYGIMVGVGSAWPGEYRGNVDNVQLRFAGQDGFTVEDNFELGAAAPTTVPEPATIALLASGLLPLALLTVLKRRSQRTNSIGS